MKSRERCVMEFKNGENRIYALDDNGEEVGEITFTDAGETMFIIDHTGVDDKMRGQGIASQLVAHAVEKARRENKKVIPLCPFAKAEFARKKEYQEVEANRK
ncbi:GNAT family N-acetyltransferase [Listeria sp. ILCC804]|uniref:GNAT family N-acetyltransferase n=1 Tax=Listeria TaxID=1637 RepID=UPI0035146243